MIADNQLLDRWLRDHDAEAFRVIVQRHANVVYAACRRILGESSLAEDVSQDCFMKLSSRQVGEIENLPAWLHRVATRRALSLARSEQRRRRNTVATTSEPADPSELVSWTEVEALVDRAIDKLPEPLRTVVVGHFLDGQSHAALAEQLDVPKRTVTDRIRRGLETVRKQLAQSGCGAWAVSFGSWSTGSWSTGSMATGSWLNGHSLVSAPPSLLSSLGKMAIAGDALTSVGVAAVATSSGVTPKLVFAAALALILCTIPLVWNPSPRADNPTSVIKPAAVDVAADVPVEQRRAIVPQPIIEPVAARILRGRVVAGGTPVAGVSVAFLCFAPNHNPVRRSPGQYHTSRYFTTHTDRHGQYRFATDLVGNGIVSAFQDRCAGATVPVKIEAGSDTVAPDLELVRGKVMRGSVLSTTGEPIADAIVALEHAHNGTDYTRGWGFTRTDETGEFTLGIHPKATRCALSVHTRGSGQSFYYEVVVEDFVRLTFAQRALLRGQITLVDGSPARKVRVKARAIMPEPRMNTMYTGITPALTFQTAVDDDGKYELHDLDPELEYRVVVVGSGRRPKSLSPTDIVPIHLEPGEAKVWNYSIEGVIVVHGVLRTQNSNRPIADRRIMVSRDGKPLWAASRNTDSEGKFELELRNGAGEYRFYSELNDPKGVGDPRFAVERQLRADESITIELLAPEPTTLPIRVVDAKGLPVQSVQARLKLTRDGHPNMIIGRSFRLDEDGRKQIAVFREATSVQVTLSAFPRGPKVSTGKLALRRGTTLPEQVFVLADACGIRGRLVDAEGQMLAEQSFEILAHYPDGTSDRRSSKTDADGAFDEKDTCRAGRVKIEIWVSRRCWRSDDLDATPESGIDVGAALIQ